MKTRDVAEEDLNLVIDKTGVDTKTAIKALRKAKNNVAIAILYAEDPETNLKNYDEDAEDS